MTISSTELLERVENLRASLPTDVEALLITAPANVRYLSGFSSPEDGVVFVDRERAILITDARYTTQAREESPLEVSIVRDRFATAAELAGSAKLGIEAEHMSVAQAETLRAALGRDLISTNGLVESLRRVKSAGEIELIREAARITDAAFERIRAFVTAGVRESDVAFELERLMRERGASSGFSIIVASGPRSALPHGVASDRLIADGDLVTIDFGACYHGYHADMTRVLAVGEPNERMRAIFDAVLEALEVALEAVTPGISGRELDAIARNVLDQHGLADGFLHSLGHGVGLDIHESPTLSPRSDDVLQSGMLVTIEPGAYVEGLGGVRIEDLVLVTDDGYEVLSKSPKTHRA